MTTPYITKAGTEIKASDLNWAANHLKNDGDWQEVENRMMDYGITDDELSEVMSVCWKKSGIQ